TPRYLHIPAAVNAAGEKLSKQTGAAPIRRAKGVLQRALSFLGQRETENLDRAVRDWNPSLIPPQRALVAAP
ncbi:MAG TPA: tRNA glutamyl-Q(34) synthetase GluQRS, partial [Burkholderiales bacterium]|nr:tRNA glutamyl-Q(34) synthetase GluQRS [Burkholderiales bacterium]